MSKRPISQPTPEDERELLALLGAESERIPLRGKKTIRLRPLTGHARIKLTEILTSRKGKEEAVTCKCLAAARLNGYFRIKFLYRILWRWYYYIRSYSEDELAEAIAHIKKKLHAEAYFRNTISLTEIRATMMQMNRQEVSRILQEQLSAKAGSSAKNNPG